MVDWLWLVGWLVDSLVRLFGWLVGWLDGWLFGWMTRENDCCVFHRAFVLNLTIDDCID